MQCILLLIQALLKIDMLTFGSKIGAQHNFEINY